MACDKHYPQVLKQKLRTHNHGKSFPLFNKWRNWAPRNNTTGRILQLAASPQKGRRRALYT